MQTLETVGVSGEPLTLEMRYAGRQRRLVVTRENLSEPEGWTITHLKSGNSMRSLIPQIMPKTIGNLTALAKAMAEGMDGHPAWAILDAVPFGKTPTHRGMAGRDVDLLRDFASKARAIGTEVYATRYIRPGRRL